MPTINYGKVSGLALDPIEKKPLYHFHPGSKILSIGSFGCNMICPFCQNHEISHPKKNIRNETIITPQELLELALEARNDGNIGVAFTYNEPLMTYDFVRDTSRLLHENGLYSVVVTNGCFGERVLDEILPHVDAFNIDLKGFRPEIYEGLNGDLNRVIHFIERAVKSSHVEITSLIVPGMNDSLIDMENQAKWIATLGEIPLHITRYFPRYKTLDIPATDINLMMDLAKVAKKYLRFVHLGNV